MDSFYTEAELREIGFKSFGRNVRISRKASLYSAERMSFGNDVRIDDFCILSGTISIGNNVHVAAGTMLFAGNTGIEIEDYGNLSSRISIYAESDDYSGMSLSNPTIPDTYKRITKGKVVLSRHALIGSGCTILPGVTIGTGVSVGSMSLVTKSLDEWGIYAGIPCKRIKERKKELLKLEREYEDVVKEQYG